MDGGIFYKYFTKSLLIFKIIQIEENYVGMLRKLRNAFLSWWKTRVRVVYKKPPKTMLSKPM